MEQYHTYRFKLNPTKEQDATFKQWLGTCRYIYNTALELKIWAWKDHKKSFSKYDLQKELTEVRNGFCWVQSVYGHTLRDVVWRLDKTYQCFFNGGGFPKWANHKEYRSFTFPDGVKIHTGQIYLPKIGKIKYIESEDAIGEIKTATVVKECDGWYICLVCQVNIEPLPQNNNSIGIDLGIKSLATLSNGTVIENPKHLLKHEVKLRAAHRAVSRKKKCSANRKKAITKLAKAHKKVRECRKDFHHKLSTQLVRENQTIVVEQLKVANMVKNHKLAKSISDAGWYQFTTMLEYKAKWYGRELIKVNPAYTSQDCNVCEYRNPNLTLAVREWECPICKTVHDRDVNAAINIKNKGGRADRASLEVIQSR